ncbi:hypothetical protein K469DRAFT_50088 [Zopfia rhizophila CBS 207.26]|uniref:Uncharacterized protein n=1 Tax=Zopfia rhizophila CBS 207.26 TaxID=1314779 RepID=A0A6A6EF57_9PEZI|nr:hypothetical protein K469DRAFT_50088 [Zopfia rhizophila CBS 207.26]
MVIGCLIIVTVCLGNGHIFSSYHPLSIFLLMQSIMLLALLPVLHQDNEDPDNFNNIKQPEKRELLPDESKQRLFEHVTEDKENAEKPWDIIAEETHNDFVSYSTIKKAFYDKGYHRYKPTYKPLNQQLEFGY